MLKNNIRLYYSLEYFKDVMSLPLLVCLLPRKYGYFKTLKEKARKEVDKMTNEDIKNRLELLNYLAEIEHKIANTYPKGSHGFYEHTQLETIYNQCYLIFADEQYYNIVRKQYESKKKGGQSLEDED